MASCAIIVSIKKEERFRKLKHDPPYFMKQSFILIGNNIKINLVEMRMLIWMVGVTRKDKENNSNIRDQIMCKMKDVK